MYTFSILPLTQAQFFFCTHCARYIEKKREDFMKIHNTFVCEHLMHSILNDDGFFFFIVKELSIRGILLYVLYTYH